MSNVDWKVDSARFKRELDPDAAVVIAAQRPIPWAGKPETPAPVERGWITSADTGEAPDAATVLVDFVKYLFGEDQGKRPLPGVGLLRLADVNAILRQFGVELQARAHPTRPDDQFVTADCGDRWENVHFFRLVRLGIPATEEDL